MSIPNNKFYSNALFKGFLYALATTVAITIVLLLIDRFAALPTIKTGYIVEKKSDAATTATLERRSSNTISPKADFSLVVFADGNYTTIDCEPNYFYAASLGHEVKFVSVKGYLTDWYWTKELIQ